MSYVNNNLRAEIATIVHNSGEGHIPSCFSIVDIIDVVYGKHINLNMVGSENPSRDIFILSKGHGALALYVVLKKYGLITEDELSSYGSHSGLFAGHPDRLKHRSLEASTGSLGHGFPMAVGAALGKKIAGLGGRVLCLVGDGETHEGTIWEAAHFAANHGLNNLIAIVDRNESSLQLLPIDDLESKFRAFGWRTLIIDGHNPVEISAGINLASEGSGPTVLIAMTTKGKGSRLVEGHGIWHHKIPNEDELAQILNELGM
jgi:transketolase